VTNPNPKDLERLIHFVAGLEDNAGDEEMPSMKPISKVLRKGFAWPTWWKTALLK